MKSLLAAGSSLDPNLAVRWISLTGTESKREHRIADLAEGRFT
jgi:hypothetical protein